MYSPQFCFIVRFGDYRKWTAEHAPIHIEGAVVEQVQSFKFLNQILFVTYTWLADGVHISKKLTWSTPLLPFISHSPSSM